MMRRDEMIKMIAVAVAIVSIIIGSFAGCGCQKVRAGYVGVKVYLLGKSKGVDSEELGVGRYYIGINEELYLFPTFAQNYVWTQNEREGSPHDESITFQTKEGMAINADIGITYRIDPTKVSIIFQRYRRGIEEITDIFLRNKVRDTFNMAASEYTVEKAYGSGKKDLLKKINEIVAADMSKEGIIVEQISAIGDFRLPPKVKQALNAKIEAIQRAEQRQYELAEAEAEAKKRVALAEADAKVLRLKAISITPLQVRYEAIQKWDGKLPVVQGDSPNIINLKDLFN